jgi:hypothetical protein
MMRLLGELLGERKNWDPMLGDLTCPVDAGGRAVGVVGPGGNRRRRPIGLAWSRPIQSAGFVGVGCITATKEPRGAPGERLERSIGASNLVNAVAPRSAAAAPVWPVGRGRVIYGAQALDMNLAGLTASEVQYALRDVLNVGRDTCPCVDGRLVSGGYTLRVGNRLEFMRAWGRKGDGRTAKDSITVSAICQTICSQGHCRQREDPHAYIPIGMLRKTLTDNELRTLSEKELRTLLRHEGIRTKKPSSQRLSVHCGDWMYYLAQREQRLQQALDATPDPAEIKEFADDLRRQRFKKHC